MRIWNFTLCSAFSLYHIGSKYLKIKKSKKWRLGFFLVAWQNSRKVYSQTTNVLTTNECRRELFCHGRPIDNIPPTGAALLKHVLRSAYIAGYVWGQFMIAHQRLSSPELWGWKYESSNYIPIWTDLPEASIVIQDLIKCKCNPELGCKQLCKCNIAHLSCTELCRCKGDCERD